MAVVEALRPGVEDQAVVCWRRKVNHIAEPSRVRIAARGKYRSHRGSPRADDRRIRQRLAVTDGPQQIEKRRPRVEYRQYGLGSRIPNTPVTLNHLPPTPPP